jgi:hypothetical protein
MRPVLLPHLRRLWRDARTLQFGTDPQRAVVLEFSDVTSVRVIDLINGERTVHQILTQARRSGIGPEQARAVLDALGDAGLLVGSHVLLPRGLAEPARTRLTGEATALALARVGPGPRRQIHGDEESPADVLRRRWTTRVLVAGHGALAAPVAAGLAAAGIGHLFPAVDGWVRPEDIAVGGLLPADVNRSRAAATADAIRRVAPEAVISPLRQTTVSFIVRVGTRTPSALAARGVRGRGVPRLEVCIRDGVVVVGPLVVPGRRPCGRCFELHRRDRDPMWPALAAQLATARDGAEPCASATLLAGAAYTVAEVLSHVDGRTARTAGATIEMAGPARVRRRSWSPHPRCECSRGRQPRHRG